MGGNAFNDTTRLNHAERDRVIQLVSQVLKSINIDYRIPVEMKGKVDFGDVDFCASNERREIVRTELMKHLSCPEPFKANGTFDHFLTKERYQVDIDYCKPEELDMHCAGTSNGDFCMLVSCFIGRKLYLSDNGLFTREPKLRVSYDPTMISAFLGLPDHALDGKTAMSKEDMFDCIERSTFFTTPPSYRRARDKKRREIFSEFVDKWIEAPENIPNQDPVTCALIFFGKQEEYDLLKYLEEQKAKDAETLRQCKAIVGGNHVKELRPDLGGKEIGDVLANIRGGRSVDEYLEYLQNLNQHEINDLILSA